MNNDEINNDFNSLADEHEFKDEYMFQAFNMYAKEKEKRKKKKIIWFSILAITIVASSSLFIKNSNNSSQILAKNSNPTKIISINQKESQKIIKGEEISKDEVSENTSNNIELAENKGKNQIQTIVKNKNSIIQNGRISDDLKQEKSNETPINLQKDLLSVAPTETKIGNDEKEIAQIESKENIDTIAEINKIVNKVDSLNTTSILENNTIINSPYQHQLWTSIGINALYNYSANSNKINPDYSIALGYTFNNHKKLTYGGSLEFYSVSNMNSVVDIYSKHYDNRSSYIEHQKISSKNLQYISLRPQINYNFWNCHQVTLSYNIDLLTSSKNIITTTREIGNNIETINSTTAYNYTKGYQRFNQSISFGYLYNFTNKFALGLSYTYGLTDITKNNVFNSDLKDKNSRTLLYLKWIIR